LSLNLKAFLEHWMLSANQITLLINGVR